MILFHPVLFLSFTRFRLRGNVGASLVTVDAQQLTCPVISNLRELGKEEDLGGGLRGLALQNLTAGVEAKTKKTMFRHQKQ